MQGRHWVLIYQYEKFIDKVLDFTMQQTFKELPLVELWYSTKEEYPQLSLQAIRAPGWLS